MKNLTKRLTVFAVLLAMLMSMMTPVFAETVTTTTGKLTVTGPSALENKTVKAFQLFSCVVTYDSDNAEEKTYTYTVNEDAKEALEAALGVTEYPSDVSEANEGQYLYDLLCEKTAAELLDIADSLKDSLTTATATTTYGTADADTGKVTAEFPNLGLGYYLLVSDNVVTTDEESEETTTKVVNPIIIDFTEDMTASMKTEFPEVDKTVKGNLENDEDYANTDSTKIGDIHWFKLETVVPDVSGKEEYAFNFVDTYSEGLTPILLTSTEACDFSTNVANFVKVTLGTRSSDSEENPLTYGKGSEYDYYVELDTKTPNRFRVIFNDPLTLFADHAGEVLKVEYRAQVNENATIGTDAASNEVYLEYTHNGDIVKSAKDLVLLTRFALIIDKYTTTLVDGADVGTIDAAGQYPLNGAEFKLYTYDDKENKVYYVVAEDGTVSFDGDRYTATVLTSGQDGDGRIIIDNIELPDKDATYYLEETEAPDGYGRYASPIKIVISVDTEETDYEEQVTVTVDGQENPTWTIRIQNEPESWLPSTGSMGTYLFIAAGVILIIGATLLRKRKVVDK